MQLLKFDMKYANIHLFIDFYDKFNAKSNKSNFRFSYEIIVLNKLFWNLIKNWTFPY